MNKCKKIICLVLVVVMMFGTFALSAMTASGDTDNKIYAFKFNEDDYKPGMATNPADSYYTENDGTLVLESNDLHKQYQMFFAVNEKNASRLEEAIITACIYYDGVLATEVYIPWAKNKWGTNCSPEIGITFMNSAKKTVCKADLAKYQPDTPSPHQVLLDVTCFIDPETGAVNYNDKIAKRDFDDALKAELENVKFSSAAAKKAVMAEIQNAGLKLYNGKIVGLSDMLDQIRENDASAFVDEKKEGLESGKARFTQKSSNGGGSMTREEILKIKDATLRQRAIAENIELFRKE